MKHRILLTVTSIVMLAGSLTAALPPTINIPLVRILSEEEALAIVKEENYIFDLIQKDENGKIVGGETFEIEPPQIILQPQSNNETTSKIATLLYDSPAKNTLIISFDHETPAEGHIMITSVLDGRKICQQNVSNGTSQTSIETSVMPDGIYEATYISNGIAVDSKRFRK